MKSHHLFLLLLFFLVSCAPSTPAPTATPAPTPTSTLKPIPTATLMPSPTPETWVAGVEDLGVELPSELFEFIFSFAKFGISTLKITGKANLYLP